MRTQSVDTPPEVEEILIARLREMSETERLQRMYELTGAARALAESRIRARYGRELDERTVTLRLAALHLDRETLQSVFGWNPEIEGY